MFVERARQRTAAMLLRDSATEGRGQPPKHNGDDRQIAGTVVDFVVDRPETNNLILLHLILRVTLQRTDPEIEWQLAAGIELRLPGFAAVVAFQHQLRTAYQTHTQFGELSARHMANVLFVHYRTIDDSHGTPTRFEV